MLKDFELVDTAVGEPVTIDIVNNLPAVANAPAVVKKKLGRPKAKKAETPILAMWYEHLNKVANIKSAQSERTYRNAIEQMYRYFSAQGKDVLKITADDISLWLSDLRAEKAPATVQLYLIAARLFFSFLCKKNFIVQNPCFIGNVTVKAKVSIDSHDEHKRSALSLEQVQKMLAEMPATTEMQLRNRAIVALMVTSGLRCCEVSEAQCGDMQSDGGYTYLVLRGKGHSEKKARVKVSPEAEKMIRQYWKVRFDGRYPKDKDYMFTSTSRNHDFVLASRKEQLKEVQSNSDVTDMLSTRTIRTIVKKAMKAIEIDDAQHVAHSLRHTCATLALEAGEPLPNVQIMMRHKNLDTTMIYQHKFDRKRNNAELAVSNLIFGE